MPALCCRLWSNNSTFSPGKPRGKSCSHCGSQQLSQHFLISCLNRSLLILRGFCSIAVLPNPTNSLKMSLRTADIEKCKQRSLYCSLAAEPSCVFSSSVLTSCVTEGFISATLTIWEHWRLFLLCVCMQLIQHEQVALNGSLELGPCPHCLCTVLLS